MVIVALFLPTADTEISEVDGKFESATAKTPSIARSIRSSLMLVLHLGPSVPSFENWLAYSAVIGQSAFAAHAGFLSVAVGFLLGADDGPDVLGEFSRRRRLKPVRAEYLL
jgi:hypothetical protein